MPPFDEVIVGYRARDPMRPFADRYGGRCVSCGGMCWFNESAFQILRGRSVNPQADGTVIVYDHDATIVCRTCYETERDFIDAAMVAG